MNRKPYGFLFEKKEVCMVGDMTMCSMARVSELIQHAEGVYLSHRLGMNQSVRSKAEIL